MEGTWNDARLSLLVHGSTQLNGRLPEDLCARIHHHLDRPNTAAAPEQPRRADDAPREIAVTDSVFVEVRAPELRHLQITDGSGRVVTVIELFSPINKLQSEDRTDFWLKRRDCVAEGIGFVQIDLLLQGEPLLHEETLWNFRSHGAVYHVATHGPDSDRIWRLYPIRLRDPLPVVEIPLRPGEQGVPLELQPLIDQAYRTGRYGHCDYRGDPPGPLSSQDRAWLDEHLRKQGLR